MTGLRILVPIYNGHDDLVRCLDSLRRTLPANRTATVLHLIDDCSPDSRIGPLLDAAAGDFPVPVVIERNSENRGFVGTVNRGFAAAGDADVVILNSDTVVAGNWLDRLTAAAGDPRVATVTPLSNNATICSYPEFCAENPMPARPDIEAIDSAFAVMNPGEVEHVPTGVGFCMLVTGAALRRVGRFDEAHFGRGYGEENDFCLRAARLGMINLAACDVYVGHAGGASFQAEKEARVRAAIAQLETLHPGYEGVIAEFCHRDPLRQARLRVWLQRLLSGAKPRVLVLSLARGGGSERFLRDWAKRAAARADLVLLRPDGHGRLRVGPLEASSTYLEFDAASARTVLTELTARLRLQKIYVNHTIDFPPQVVEWVADCGLDYQIMLHDYFLLGGSPTEPPEVTDMEPSASGSEAGRWYSRGLAERLVAGAGNLFCPSAAAARIVVESFPDADVVVAAHPEQAGDTLPVRVRARQGRKCRVAVIGALSREKGADLLSAVANLAFGAAPGLEFVLVGYAYRELGPHVFTTGRYDERELPDLLRSLEPDLVWLPARWAETYSYTLSSALELGAPLLVPDIGAFPERTRGRPFTFVYPAHQSPEAMLATLTDAEAVLSRAGQTVEDWSPLPPFDHESELGRWLDDAIAPPPLSPEDSRRGALELVHLGRRPGLRTQLGAALLRYRQRSGWRQLARWTPGVIKRPLLRAVRLIS